LGIELPEPEENTIKNRIFIRNLREVSGDRFDPDYFQRYFKNLENVILSSSFNVEKMREVTTLIKNGHTPASSEYAEETTLYPIIKAGSYNGDFIALDKVDFTKSQKNLQAKKFDIFILSAAHQAHYVGRSIKYLDSKPIDSTSFVGELICVRVDPNRCHSMYLFSLLKTKLYKDLLNREKTGQTSHIYPKDIQHILVPIPPLEKQIEISEHITAIRNQAKQLQQQAKDDLEKAKQEVEAMILGDD